jgi:hypothetical protein
MYFATKFALSLLALSLSIPLLAQANSPLEALGDHFAGTWVGTNHYYTKGSVVTSNVTIEITKGKKPGHLNLKYTYVAEATKKVDHYKAEIVIDPATSAWVRHWEGSEKDHFKIEDLGTLLRDGYGDFTVRGFFPSGDEKHEGYRADYHLTPQTLNYECFKSIDGAAFVKTGDWITTRETATTGSR